MTAVMGTAQRGAATQVIAHLAAVWLAGYLLTQFQLYAAFIILHAGGGGALLTAAVVGVTVILVVILAAAAFAGLGFAFRASVPLLHRARGVWAWAAGVYVLGTIGAFGAGLVNFTISRWEAGDWLCPAGGACYALAAASFLPGIRVRLGALGAATVLAAGGSYAAWAAAQPPTLDEWITANGVDRALLKVGGPPPGYTLKVVGASEVGFRVEYERPHSLPLHLDVERTEHNNPRTDARGCPVSLGVTVRCKDDGAGRRLLTYENGYEHQDLCLRRDGLVYTVTMEGFHGDLPAARHILSTLRPATDTELGDLVELPTRR
jgi:hypothetical protein